jgi:nucleoside-diphosphate-sugar epimerase
MKKILLTGGLGYIGSYFVENYSEKYAIKIIDTNYFQYQYKNDKNFNNPLIKDTRNIIKEDINDIDYIVHMGELSNDPLGDLNKDLTKDINHVATKNLLELANKSNIKKFIYMSSASVYGFSEEIMDESSPVKPLTEYSKAKVLNEQYILQNNFSFETVILRNSTAFGFSKNLRLDLVVNDLTYGGLVNNEINLLSDGTPRRPLVHIHDICNTIHTVINDSRNLDKEVFNVGSDKMNYSIKDIAEKIGISLNLEQITFGKHDSDQRSYVLNFKKLNSFFPNFNIKYTLEEGIDDLVKNLKRYEITGSEKRIKILNELIDYKKIDKNLYWIK